MSTGRRLTKTETKQITKQNKKFSPEHPNLGHRVERKLHIDPGFTSLGTFFSFIRTAHCCTSGSDENTTLARNADGKRAFGRPRHRLNNN